MIRLLVSMLCALGLAFSPVVATAAVAAGKMPGCTMNGKMPDTPSNHDKMDCCTAACQMTSATALLPESGTTDAPLEMNGALHHRLVLVEPISIIPLALDPPPRSIFS